MKIEKNPNLEATLGVVEEFKKQCNEDLRLLVINNVVIDIDLFCHGIEQGYKLTYYITNNDINLDCGTFFISYKKRAMGMITIYHCNMKSDTIRDAVGHKHFHYNDTKATVEHIVELLIEKYKENMEEIK